MGVLLSIECHKRFKPNTLPPYEPDVCSFQALYDGFLPISTLTHFKCFPTDVSKSWLYYTPLKTEILEGRKRKGKAKRAGVSHEE